MPERVGEHIREGIQLVMVAQERMKTLSFKDETSGEVLEAIADMDAAITRLQHAAAIMSSLEKYIPTLEEIHTLGRELSRLTQKEFNGSTTAIQVIWKNKARKVLEQLANLRKTT